MPGEKTPKKKIKSAAATLPATEVKQKPKHAAALDDGRPATVGKKPKPSSQPLAGSMNGVKDAPKSSKKRKAGAQPEQGRQEEAAGLGSNGGAPSKQQAHNVGSSAPGNDDGLGNEVGQRHHKGKKRKRKGVDESALLPEERERRRRQRDLRELALKLRAKGQNYNPKRARRAGEQEKERGHKPRRAVQVIIVPIYWNKKADEKDVVLGAAERAQQLLRDAGIKCDTDTTNEKTPGQKYRYWEERGVALRIELGPKEAQAGRCVLAKCRNPGEVAQKSQLEVGEELVAAVRSALGTAGAAQPGVTAPSGSAPAQSTPLQQQPPQYNSAETRQKGNAKEAAPLKSGSDGKAKQAKHSAAAPAAAEMPTGQQAKQQQQQLAAQAGSLAAVQRPAAEVASGDALEDDFAALRSQQEKAAAGEGKKGKKRGGGGDAAALEEGDEEGLRVLLGGGEGGGGKRSKGPKLVKF